MDLFLSGDVMLGRGIDQILPHPCEPTLHEPYMEDARDYITIAEQISGPVPRQVPADYPWGDALALLDAAAPDVRIINLETSITRAEVWDRDKVIHYRVSPENASCLAAARIDLVTLANNHVLDWGPAGLCETLDVLDRLGVARCGAGRDRAEALRPAVIERAGGERVVVFAIGCPDAGVPVWWAAGPERPGVLVVDDLGDATVRALARAIEPWRSDHVVLSIHWGPNWGDEIADAHRRFAHRIIDEAGVRVVHGHSSHHVKGIEVYRGQPIFYGCGDLLTDYEGITGHEGYRGDLGLLYLVSLDHEGRLRRLAMHPTRMQRFRITRATPPDARWLAATLARTGKALGTSVTIEDGHLELVW